METMTGQARNWIYPRIGSVKPRDFSATDADRFFRQIAPFLSKRSLVMIKSTLRRSIRRAQVHDLIGRNVIELIDLPSGKPGRPSRAMTEEQAAKVLKTAKGQGNRLRQSRQGEQGPIWARPMSRPTPAVLACGTKSHWKAPITEVSRELKDATCLSCRSQLGLDNTGNATAAPGGPVRPVDHPGLAPRRAPGASSDLGSRRPGQGEWSTSGARPARPATPRPPKSKRSLILPKRAITALKAHKAKQDRERREAAGAKPGTTTTSSSAT